MQVAEGRYHAGNTDSRRAWCRLQADELQIRCSGEQPICKRCLRLNRSCTYSTNLTVAKHGSRPPWDSMAMRTASCTPSASTSTKKGRTIASNNEASQARNYTTSPEPLLRQPVEERYYGVPNSLILQLVEVYYENMYNARLLLHKRIFLESLAAGTAKPHTVLSVCACAAKYVNGVAHVLSRRANIMVCT